MFSLHFTGKLPLSRTRLNKRTRRRRIYGNVHLNISILVPSSPEAHPFLNEHMLVSTTYSVMILFSSESLTICVSISSSVSSILSGAVDSH